MTARGSHAARPRALASPTDAGGRDATRAARNERERDGERERGRETEREGENAEVEVLRSLVVADQRGAEGRACVAANADYSA